MNKLSEPKYVIATRTCTITGMFTSVRSSRRRSHQRFVLLHIGARSAPHAFAFATTSSPVRPSSTTLLPSSPISLRSPDHCCLGPTPISIKPEKVWDQASPSISPQVAES
ncbi:hypothetical protein TIFTF001_009729 [Ficus carica]|uniref:Uncharacterized protein n=1 Tax=Ficus carica TaxID=3494 RepID=A0AA88CZ76_FICCA|nr:hypothetical protein TIFTF001_009729 [Ficus carica]